MDSEALSSRQHCLISSDDDGTSDDDLSLFIKSESETHKLLKNQQNLACHPSATASVPVTSFHHRNGRYAKYTSLAHNEHGFGGLVGQSSRRSRLLYSPWTVFSITILFFLLLYIPLFTFRDSTGMCKSTLIEALKERHFIVASSGRPNTRMGGEHDARHSLLCAAPAQYNPNRSRPHLRRQNAAIDRRLFVVG